jgi:hypothetical protein
MLGTSAFSAQTEFSVGTGHRYVFQDRLKIAGGLVEGGKPKKDDRSAGSASERRLGGLLEQRASGSCMTRTLNYTYYTPSDCISQGES